MMSTARDKELGSKAGSEVESGFVFRQRDSCMLCCSMRLSKFSFLLCSDLILSSRLISCFFTLSISDLTSRTSSRFDSSSMIRAFAVSKELL